MAIKIPIKRTVGRPLKVMIPMTEWARETAQWVADYMTKHDRIATGDSIESIILEVIKPNQVNINAASSVAFALQGRKSGGGPPKGVIEKWIRAKKQLFRVSGDMVAGNGGPITIKSLAFLIGRKIRSKGTDPPKLRAQNITLVIDNFGKKFLPQIGLVHAQELNQIWMKSIAERENTSIKTTGG